MPLVAAGLAVAAWGCRVKAGSSKPVEFVPGSVGEVPILGLGYDSIAHKVTGTSCFNLADGATSDSSEFSQASLTLQDNADAKALNNAISAEIGMKYPIYPGIDAVGTLNFSRQFSHTEYTENKVLTFTAVANRRHIDLRGTETLAPVVSTVLARPAFSDVQRKIAIRAMCGDQFVQEVQYGMQLTAVIKMEFNNQYDARAFGGSLGAEVLGGIASVTLGTELRQVAKSSNASVTLAITQTGGNPTDLLCILPGGTPSPSCASLIDSLPKTTSTNPDIIKAEAKADEAGPALLLQCTFDNREQCYKVFRAVYGYASKINNQVNSGGVASADGGITTASNLMPVRFITAANPVTLQELHADYGPDPTFNIEATRQAIDGFRDSLMARLSGAMEDHRRAQSLKAKFAGLSISPTVANSLDNIITKSQALTKAVRGYLGRCLSFTPQLGTSQTAQAIKDQINGLLSTCSSGDQYITAHTQPGQDLYYDRVSLNPQPQSVSDYCVLSYYSGILNEDDRHTALAAVRSRRPNGLNPDINAPVTAAVCGTTTDDSCKGSLKCLCDVVECELTSGVKSTGILNFSQQSLASLRPIVPLFTPNLTTINLAHNKLESALPIAALPLSALIQLNLSDNLLSTLKDVAAITPSSNSALMLADNEIDNVQALTGKWAWPTVDLSSNLIQTIASGSYNFAASSLQSLDLSNNPLNDVSGLASVPTNNFRLNLSGATNVACPFATPDHLNRVCQ